VRELQNIIERANVLAEGPTIEVQTIAAWLDGVATPELGDAGHAGEGGEGDLLADMERRLILSTLKRFGGRRAQTAAALGIGLRTLGMKLKRYRQESPREMAENSAIPAG
jgi:two-component system, NtrC family, response regulator HydG